MAAGYSLDTSGLIDGIERFYPPRNFPALWGNIDRLIDDGRLRISEEAWREAISVDAPLKDWCLDPAHNRIRCVYPTDAEVARIVGEIVTDYPQWIKQGGKNGADPFVIATAEVGGWTVISGERDGGPANPKIPYVSRQRRVPHGRIVDLIRAEDWVIG